VYLISTSTLAVSYITPIHLPSSTLSISVDSTTMHPAHTRTRGASLILPLTPSWSEVPSAGPARRLQV
jgi:hypothetical protein